VSSTGSLATFLAAVEIELLRIEISGPFAQPAILGMFRVGKACSNST
jgi:hypothetical protein